MNENFKYLLICGWCWSISMGGVNASPNPNLAATDKLDRNLSVINTRNLKISPLARQLFIQPNANHLGAGEVTFNLDTRLYFLPDLVAGNVDNSDSAVNFNTGFSWGITDNSQLTLQFQHVDSSSPARQGVFTSERTEDNEAALEFKQRLWKNSDDTQALSGVVSASWGTRGFQFTGRGEITEVNNRNVYVALSVPYTATVNERWQFNVAPIIAFFNDDNAEFFQRLPDDENSSFGTTLGLSGGVAYEINPRLSVWGDLFLPLTGNNSISRESGNPNKVIVYNAGFRYLINPRLALDIYASNTFASFAPLSLTGDRDLVGIGTNLVFMPDLFVANRRYPNRFKPNKNNPPTPLTTDGIGFLDGGIVNSQQFLLNFQGGSQGILTALHYGVLEDFELGVYLDYVSRDVDESEQGISGKIRLLNQAENSPVTLSLVGTASITNEPFLNFLDNNNNAFNASDLDKTIPIFTPGGDDIDRGEQLIVTASLPINYNFDRNTAIWFTPTLGYVQRSGTEIAGFNLGGSLSMSQEFSILGEVGANFAGRGNTFIDGTLSDRIPWTLGVRWTPLSLLNLEISETNSNPQLELYITNRVGSSPWHQLRVREDNEIAVGAGLLLPF
jgi:hypothetical protein